MEFISLSTDVDAELSLSDMKRINCEFSDIVLFISTFFFDKKNYKDSIRIYLTDKREKEMVIAPVKNVFSSVRCFLYFDFERFLSQSDFLSKKEMIIEAIKSGVKESVEFMKWDMDSFNDIFNKIDELQLKFTYRFSKPIAFKKTGVLGWIESSIEPGFRNYSLVFGFPNGDVRRENLITTNSFYNISLEKSRILSDVKWKDENTFVVLGKKGHLERIRFEYNIFNDLLSRTFNLEPDINEADFYEEFELATTVESTKIDMILNPKNSNKWHYYL